jgi:hypothetical protein
MALGTSFYSGAFAPAKRTSPIDNTDYELSDAYKPTGSTTQPERSLTGGASAPDPGAGAHPFSPPGTSGTSGSGTSQPGVINDPYAPMLKHLSDASDRLESAYSAPHAGTARQIIGAILSRRNPGLGGLVSGETQRNRGIEQAQQDYGIASSQLGAARILQNQQIENNLKISQGKKADADAAYATSHANVIENPIPKPTPEEQDIQDLMKPGNINPATQKPYTFHEARDAAAQGIQDTKPDKTTGLKPSEEDKALSDYLQGHNLPDTPANRDRARSVLKTRDKPAKDPDLADINKQLAEERLRKMQEPTGPEKNRADLAKNLNENLDTLEEIVNRRPDLFGPGAGRMTELHMMIGSSDPDIAALQNIKHQAGMAQISAHGMRSAQGVDSAAQALMNFHNEPQAIKGAIHSARNSVGTFAKDVEDTRNRISGAAPAAAPAGPSVPSFKDWKKSQQ